MTVPGQCLEKAVAADCPPSSGDLLFNPVEISPAMVTVHMPKIRQISARSSASHLMPLRKSIAHQLHDSVAPARGGCSPTITRESAMRAGWWRAPHPGAPCTLLLVNDP